MTIPIESNNGKVSSSTAAAQLNAQLSSIVAKAGAAGPVTQSSSTQSQVSTVGNNSLPISSTLPMSTTAVNAAAPQDAVTQAAAAPSKNPLKNIANKVSHI